MVLKSRHWIMKSKNHHVHIKIVILEVKTQVRTVVNRVAIGAILPRCEGSCMVQRS